ncbi:pilus assembly PilX N-terminal domain-containing protein [Pseudomonas sp. 5P_3.1_Bac2]|uniref:pilus assembly PilX N-terminal domain-containing protein n=1 Tax=Pseudomonas sp. 5P_3.1_Bac2 TaxID=2971617 RepID=UPI0021C880AE|nr:pilus assembly PilX N-terminal domain-containing protein [Pseudomonas sp. 5P_3.1_Bac2]MCU1718155.1 pilus assembly PilX N-terminal domain-containing protein [Pseudomonas sp. 5P_3.1_Bac2]
MKPANHQRGVALLVSLILLLLLTIIAITAATTSTLQQRMASNAQEANTAFQAAESGLAVWLNNFETESATPSGWQSAGAEAQYQVSTTVVGNCLGGSLAVGAGFVFVCHHVSSESRTSTDADNAARSRHRMGYLTRTGQ